MLGDPVPGGSAPEGSTPDGPEPGWRSDEWFSALVTEHSGAVFRYIKRRLPPSGGSAHNDAEDLTADVLATAWRRRDDIPDGFELPWLYRTAGFVLANFGRKARPTPVADIPDYPDGVDVENLVIADDDVRRALAALSRRDQQILLLHAWEGLGGEELAAVLGVTRGGADAALSRARARLRDAWSA